MAGAGRRLRVDIEALCDEALRHHAEGELQEAERLCRRILALDPDQVEMLHLLGMIAAETGRSAEAVEWIDRAIALNGEIPAFHYTLGRAFELEGKPAEALLNWGNGLRDEGRWAEAADCYWRALALVPGLAAGYANLGHVALAEGDAEGAVAYYRQALTLRPGYAAAEAGLGYGLAALGLSGDAIEHIQRAFTLDPANAEAASRLGDIYHQLGDFDEAVVWYNQALALRPALPMAHDGLGHVLADRGWCGAASEHFRQAVIARPQWAEAHAALGASLRDQGLAEAAVKSFRRALDLRPNFAEAHSRLLEALRLDDHVDATERAAEARRFGALLDARKADSPSPIDYPNQRDSERRLRIGYLSPDFRRCLTASFLEPPLANRDRRQVEVVCYAEIARPDVITSHFKKMADHWVDTVGLDDDALAEQIRADGVDILVDWAGHRPGNRLPVFVRRPAPIQLAWPADGDTTGLTVMDWRLTDAVIEPEGAADLLSTERLVRLPHGCRCWQPPIDDPVSTTMDLVGPVTFGSFAPLAGLSPNVIAVWAEVLRRLPVARLRLGNRALGDPLVATAVRERFGSHGIASGRLDLVRSSSDSGARRTLLSRVDVVLDMFPCSAPAALCEALWMGVPVVTLVGEGPAGRAGASLLARAGFKALIAETQARYVELALSLATNPTARDNFRRAARARLVTSPLCDGLGLARLVETAYRALWRQWCLGG